MSLPLWVLYDESGEYSDYGMGIKGVFSSAEQAMDAFDNFWTEEDERYPSNSLKWKEWVYADHCWHKEIACAPGSYGGYSATAAPYVLDQISNT